jgi:TetR/AcrR family transcriptional regulator, transcriptional repressor for nem operon
MSRKTQSRAPADRAPHEQGYVATRSVLIRCGMEILTEQGFTATGLDAVLKRATVPKGSFYYYFDSKAAFGREVLQAYDAFFCRKIERALMNEARSPLQRLYDFMEDAKAGMAKYRYARGCLVGNLGQEVEALPDGYRAQLNGILQGWQTRVADCLRLAVAAGEIDRRVDCDALAEYFWIGWEGAVMRARMMRSGHPLDTFISGFVRGLPR